MSQDDVLFGYRLRLFALACEIGVRPACRPRGVHHSTYYRWRRAGRWGLEALRVQERRRPRMPNELGPHLEQRIIALSHVKASEPGRSSGSTVSTSAGCPARSVLSSSIPR